MSLRSGRARTLAAFLQAVELGQSECLIKAICLNLAWTCEEYAEIKRQISARNNESSHGQKPDNVNVLGGPLLPGS